MTDLVDVILAFHNAFRNDMQRIDAAARDMARGSQGLSATVERFRFFNEILVWHAEGEELGVFPAVDAVAPLVSEAYLMDHRGLDDAYDSLNTAYSAHDLLETARATAAFRFHLDMHLGKEDVHLYRIFRERVPAAEKGKVLGIMSRSIPPDRVPETIAWLFPLVGHDDREHVVRIWQTVMPPPVFASVKGLVKKAVGSDWAELVRRIPSLESE
jgi:hypothetical protein